MTLLLQHIIAILFTYWLASDILCLLALRLARPADDDAAREIFFLTRGLGPIAISWLLFHLLIVIPGSQPAVYIAAIPLFFAGLLVAGRKHLPELAGIYSGLYQAVHSRAALSRRSWVLLGLIVAICLFIFVIGIGFPIVEGDALGFAIESRLIYRDLSFLHYPTYAADPATGYYYHTWQIPCLQTLYVWFFLLTGTSTLDLLPRTVAPMYAMYSLLLVCWVLFQRTRRFETALWGGLALVATPLFATHSYFNTQDPHRIYLSFCALILVARLIKRPTMGTTLLAGIFLGFTIYAHFFGILTLGTVGLLYLWLCQAPARTRLQTLTVLGFVAVLFSASHFYLRGSEQQRVVRQLSITTTDSATRQRAQEWNDWLLRRRGQAGTLRQFLFGRLMIFTGLEWFGALFWLFVLSLIVWAYGWRQTVLERVMAGTSLINAAVVLSGIRSLSWSNPRYIGTLMPVAAYFAALLIMTALDRVRAGSRPWLRAPSFACMILVLVVPLTVTTTVRGAKVGITNAGNFYNQLHSTAWVKAAIFHPLASTQAFWNRYIGIKQTLKYLWAADDVKVLHAHNYFGAVQYMRCCTAPDATALVLGRQTYYFYYAGRKGVSMVDPRVHQFFAMTDPHEACTFLTGLGVNYVLIDSYYGDHPYYTETALRRILSDRAWSADVYQNGTAHVYRLTCK